MRVLIGFSKPSKFKLGAKLISWWMGTQYSHVFIQFEYQDSKSAVFHASHGQVHFKSLQNFLKENIVVRQFGRDVSPKLHEELFDRCMDLSGEKYSILELGKIFCSDLIKQLTNDDSDLGDSRGYICSELVGKLLLEYFNSKFDKSLYTLKPTDIEKELSKDVLWQN